jgi:nicotinamide-nucleotide amidase
LFDPDILSLAETVLAACRSRGWRVATAESCTGGLVTAALTAIAGASDVVERGFVTYSNASKVELLGVSPETIAGHGAISAETAAAMARGAVARAGADLAVSVTGIAGPAGGTPRKPVGLVYLGVARGDDAIRVERRLFAGDRAAIRRAALIEALELLRSEAQRGENPGSERGG